MKRLVRRASFNLSSYEVGQIISDVEMDNFEKNHNPNGYAGREFASLYFNGKIYNGDDHTPMMFDILDSGEFLQIDFQGEDPEEFFEKNVIFYDHYKTDKGEHFFIIQEYRSEAEHLLQESFNTITAEYNCPIFEIVNGGYERVA